jgi:hypothetical protein
MAWSPDTDKSALTSAELTAMLEKKYPNISKNPLFQEAMDPKLFELLAKLDPVRVRANARLRGYLPSLSDAQHTKIVKETAGVRTYHKRKNSAAPSTGVVLNQIRLRIARNSAYDADIESQWRVATTNTYESKDLPVLAAREALQNSVDAIRQAVKKRLIPADTGVFEIVVNEANRTIQFRDNGTGMNRDVIKTFLTLSGSGAEKKATTDPGINLTVRRYRRSDDRGSYYFRLNGLFQFRQGMFNTNSTAKMPYDYVLDYVTGGTAGGFGLAKAVILGCSESKPPQWSLRTQNLYYDSTMADNDERGKPMPRVVSDYYQGTILEIQNIGMIDKVSYQYRYPGNDYVYTMTENPDPIRERLRILLEFSDCPDIKLMLNGEVIEPYFSGKRGSKITEDSENPRYPRGLRGGSGLAGTSGYPFNIGRDRLNSASEKEALREFAAEVEEEPTIKVDKEDIIFDPAFSSGTPPTEAEAKYQAEFTSTLQSGEVQDTLAQAIEIAMQFQNTVMEGLLQKEISKIKAEQRADQVEGRSHAPSSEAPNFKPSAGTQLTEELIEARKAAEQRRDAPWYLFWRVFSSYNEMATKENYTPVDLYLIRDAMDSLASRSADSGLSFSAIVGIEEQVEIIIKQSVGSGGGGLAQIAPIRQIVDQFYDEYVDPYTLKQARQGRNPFGAMGGLYISRKQFLDKEGRFNSAKARDFQNNAGKYIPYLLMWDQILRLITQLNSIKIRYYPGFTLNDTAIAVYHTLRSGTRMVAINPYWFKQAKKGYDNAQDLALFLHAVACHELAHMVRGTSHATGNGHDEQFSITRERIARYSFPAVSAIKALVAQTLGVPDLTSKGKRSAADKERIAELEAQVAAGCPGCLKELVTKLEESNRLDTVKWLNAKAGGGE